MEVQPMDANAQVPPGREREELSLSGRSIAPGLGMGSARVVGDALQAAAEGQRAQPGEAERELDRTRAAIDATRRELEESARRVETQFDPALAGIFRAHGTVLDGLLSSGELEKELRDSRLGAEAAVGRVFRRWQEKFLALKVEAFRQRADDIADLGRRVLRHLQGENGSRFGDVPAGCVLVLDRLLPSDVVALSGRALAAVVVESLGQGSHAALLAREKSIPTVAGFPGLTQRVRDGDELLVDGYRGTLVVHPGPATRESFQERLRQYGASLARCKGACQEPARTLDGELVTVEANIGVYEDVALALDNGADGVGLFRLEQLYLARELPPTEEELFEELRTVLAPLGDRPVTVRLLDVGGDKPLPFLRFPGEANPALGRRGVRLLLEYIPLARTQLAALLRLAQERPIRVLVPLVTLEEDIEAVRALLEATARDLGVPRLPPLGAMIETPAAALSVPAIARHVDYLSVGTNDLTQYTMAAGRDDPAVNHYYVEDHAAVWRLLSIIVTEAGKTPVSLCGELAAREEVIPRLLELGYRAFSMAPSLIPSAKERIRTLHLQDETVADVSRIEPADLKAQLASGRPITFLDARSDDGWNASRGKVPGAIRIGSDGVVADPSWHRDRLTVVYCDCPGDAGAAIVARELRDRGFSQAAVLHGGFDGWASAGGPVEPKAGRARVHGP
jgi:phosphoenolpyruvate-protein phosphotransferase